jgi:acyl dehydratase
MPERVLSLPRGPKMSRADFEAKIGQDLGASEWLLIDQAMIDAFADLTLDHNPIHIDPKVGAATPFGATIAHGFLTLSLLSNFAYQVLPSSGARMGVNYGLNRLRFISPVRVGSRVRGRFHLKSIESEDGRSTITTSVTVEIEGEERPALVAEWVSMVWY